MSPYDHVMTHIIRRMPRVSTPRIEIFAFPFISVIARIWGLLHTSLRSSGQHKCLNTEASRSSNWAQFFSFINKTDFPNDGNGTTLAICCNLTAGAAASDEFSNTSNAV